MVRHKTPLWLYVLSWMVYEEPKTWVNFFFSCLVSLSYLKGYLNSSHNFLSQLWNWGGGSSWSNLQCEASDYSIKSNSAKPTRRSKTPHSICWRLSSKDTMIYRERVEMLLNLLPCGKNLKSSKKPTIVVVFLSKPSSVIFFLQLMLSD